MHFLVVLKLSSCRGSFATNFFGDKFVIRSSRHITGTFSGLLAGATMRASMSWNAFVCLQPEGSNYRPKQDRSGNPEQVI
jgi:hypothetical protein